MAALVSVRVLMCSCRQGTHMLADAFGRLCVSVCHIDRLHGAFHTACNGLGDIFGASLCGAGGARWRAVLLPQLLCNGHADSTLAGMRAALAECPCHKQAADAARKSAAYVRSFCISRDACCPDTCRRQGYGSGSRRSSRWCRSRAALAMPLTPPCGTSMRALMAAGAPCCSPCAAARCPVPAAHAWCRHSNTLAQLHLRVQAVTPLIEFSFLPRQT